MCETVQPPPLYNKISNANGGYLFSNMPIDQSGSYTTKVGILTRDCLLVNI